MKKPVWHSLIFTVIICLVVFVLNALSPSMPLSSRAIVVGIAIDLEGDQVHLAAQIIQSGSSGESSKPGNSTYAILKGKGDSLSTAIYDITSSSGYFVSLAHCSAVILGESMRGVDCFMPLSYLVKNTKLADDAVVVFSEGKGEDLLKNEVGLSFLSAFGLKKLESANIDYSKAVNCSVREFMVCEKSVLSTKVVPLVRLGEKIEEPEGAQQNSGEKVEFDLDEAVVISRAGEVVLNETQTFGYNLVKKNFKLGNVTLKDGNDITDLVFSTKSSSMELTRSNNGCELTAKIEITFLAFSEGRRVGHEREISNQAILNLEQEYADAISDVFEISRDIGLDVYCACEERVRAFGEDFDAEEFMRSLTFTAQVKINII